MPVALASTGSSRAAGTASVGRHKGDEADEDIEKKNKHATEMMVFRHIIRLLGLNGALCFLTRPVNVLSI